jgi:putative transposase
MRHNKLRLYVHLIWSTWNRWPLITPEIERALYREIEREAMRLQCKVLALGGVENHVHLLLEMPAVMTLADVVKQIKGASSLFVNDTLHPEGHFKWQGNYAAFTVSRWDVANLIGYIQRQKEHHSGGTTKRALEFE